MEKIWKDIKGYEGLYQVSNLGEIKILSKKLKTGLKNNPYIQRKEKILKKQKNKLKYEHAIITKDGKAHNISIHKVVAETFLDKNNFKSMPYEDRTKIDLNKLVVNHKDENPSNNCIDNLEWCTQCYNINYGTRNNKVSKTMINFEKYSVKVNQYDLDGNFIKTWNSLKEIERTLGFSRSGISNCCRGIYKQMKGYKWEYYDETRIKRVV